MTRQANTVSALKLYGDRDIDADGAVERFVVDGGNPTSGSRGA